VRYVLRIATARHLLGHLHASHRPLGASRRAALGAGSSAVLAVTFHHFAMTAIVVAVP